MNRFCWVLVGAVALGACSDHSQHAGHDAAPQVGVAQQVQGDIAVSNAWLRPTIEGQDATGAYLTITAGQALALVGATSPAAEIIEVHEMKMDGDVMRMRRAEKLNLEPGQPLALKPGGFHLMMMALPAPIPQGQAVDLVLNFEKPDGTKIDMPIKAKAQQLGTGAAAQGSHHH